MVKYTIIMTSWQFGHMEKVVEQDQVRCECERLKKVLSFGEDTHKRIEVLNNETGEIREYWNSEQNKTLF